MQSISIVIFVIRYIFLFLIPIVYKNRGFYTDAVVSEHVQCRWQIFTVLPLVSYQVYYEELYMSKIYL